MTDPFMHNLVHFVRYLRAAGLSVVPTTTADLAAAAAAVGWEHPEDVRHAFRSVVASRPDDLAVFDAAFDAFFGTGEGLAPRRPDLLELQVHDRQHLRAAVPVMADRDRDDESPPRDDLEEQVGASYLERLSRRDFADLSAEEQAEVRRLIARMIWRPADLPGRRLRPLRSGSRPDLRRTLRRVVSASGDLAPLAMAEVRPRRRPLIVVADVSGSMERYSEMLLYFIHAAQGRLGRLEAFVFSTHLTRITREIRHREPGEALSRVGSAVDDWSGGTRIGEALHEFNWRWSRRVTRGGPVALIVSDGWDRGDPALLHEEMGRFARSVHRVVWLNPLAGRPGYEPATRGMRAVLPFVDHLLASATVTDLASVVRLLESVPARRRDIVKVSRP